MGVTSLDVKRRAKESTLAPYWCEESQRCVAKFAAPGAHLIPYVEVEGGIRTRGGTGKLLQVIGHEAMVLLDNETEELRTASVNRRQPIARFVRISDVYPAHVTVEAINKERAERKARRESA